MNRKHVVVLGSGLAGLLAAKVLSETFETVTLLERDTEFDERKTRFGVPHSPHAHILFNKGRSVVSKLFPNIFENELRASGQGAAEMPKDFMFLGRFGWMNRIPTNIITHTASRAFLEGKIRDRVNALQNVKFISGVAVCGLIHDPNSNTINGVKYQFGNNKKAEVIDCNADFVVCALGRHGKLDSWLKQIGLEPPMSKVVEANEDYASCVFRHTDRPKNWKVVVLTPAPPLRPYGAVLFPAEDNTFICTLRCPRNQVPPSTHEGFWNCLKDIAGGFMADVLKGAEPISSVMYYRRLTNVCHYYSHVEKWPKRLVVIGDSLAYLNPGFGQGMSASATSVELLQEALPTYKNDGRWENNFHRELIKRLGSAWMFATLGDDILDLSTLQNSNEPTKWFFRLKKQIRARIMREFASAATVDPTLEILFFSVLNMIKPISNIFRPSTIFRIMRANLFRQHLKIATLEIKNDIESDITYKLSS